MGDGGSLHCTASEHGSCAACGAFVTRRSPHSHEWGIAGFHHHIVCGECRATIAAAALPVLQACDELGIGANHYEVSKALQERLVYVLAQLRLPGQ
jgi:hypothetical protein